MLLLTIARQWLVKIACPQFKNSFALTYKGFFFYGKEVRKAQPFSGMLCPAHLGFRTSPSQVCLLSVERVSNTF